MLLKVKTLGGCITRADGRDVKLKEWTIFKLYLVTSDIILMIDHLIKGVVHRIIFITKFARKDVNRLKLYRFLLYEILLSFRRLHF